jgi:Lon protease-like protein
MEIPREAPVMTLPNATLFPRALLPIYIFEPRYRRMLDETLHSDRMIIIAMRKSGATRDLPCCIAGLGVVRVCVENADGTSHLILEGLSRVALGRTVRHRPFRINRFETLQTPSRDSVAIDALMAKLRDLVGERIRQEMPAMKNVSKTVSIKEVISSLELNDPDRVADLVTWSLLRDAEEKQTILETIEVEPRLRRLIHFLMAEIRQQGKTKTA